MLARIVVNWAPYPERSKRFAEQLRAFQTLEELAPPWCSLVMAILPREPLPGLAGLGLDRWSVAVLPRDAFPVAHRNLPFMRDVLDLACDGQQDRAWGGLLNSDILVTARFFERLVEAPAASGAIIGHRTDVLHHDTPPEQGRKVNQKTCTDGFFIRAGIWNEHRAAVPDFVLGEPLWDTGMIFWSKAKKLHPLHLGDHELLHVKHGRHWTNKGPGATWNGQLGRRMWGGRRPR